MKSGRPAQTRSRTSTGQGRPPPASTAAPGEPRAGGQNTLILWAASAYLIGSFLWRALTPGLGLFAIRLTSDAAWWSGHLTFTIE